MHDFFQSKSVSCGYCVAYLLLHFIVEFRSFSKQFTQTCSEYIAFLFFLLILFSNAILRQRCLFFANVQCAYYIKNQQYFEFCTRVLGGILQSFQRTSNNFLIFACYRHHAEQREISRPVERTWNAYRSPLERFSPHKSAHEHDRCRFIGTFIFVGFLIFFVFLNFKSTVW